MIIKLVPYEDIIIDIYPPYDHIRLVYISTIGIKCPKCGAKYTRDKWDINFNPHNDIIHCVHCDFKSKFIGWQIKTTLCN